MATVYFTRYNSDAEELYRSFLSIEEANSLRDDLNTDEDNFIDDEQICFFGVFKENYTRESFYPEYYSEDFF